MNEAYGSRKMRKCTADDIPILLPMYRQLRIDEGYHEPWDDEKGEARLRKAFETGHIGYLFVRGADIVGYALVNLYTYEERPNYLEQFFIKEESRRAGNGREFFKMILDDLGCEILDLDVLVWNDAALKFWESLGFSELCHFMRFVKPRK